jgi:hypothetical protein
MSSSARRAEKAREWEEELRQRDEENRRVASLTVDERIDECDANDSVKDILRILAEKAGIRWEVP